MVIVLQNDSGHLSCWLICDQNIRLPLRVPEATVFPERLFMRLIKGSLAGLVLTGILAMMPAPGLMGQTTVHIAQAAVGRVQVPRVQLNLTPQHTANPSNIR